MRSMAAVKKAAWEAADDRHYLQLAPGIGAQVIWSERAPKGYVCWVLGTEQATVYQSDDVAKMFCEKRLRELLTQALEGLPA